MYTAKQTIITVQANPKTHPGGVQGALFNSSYQTEPAPLPAKKPPKARALKLKNKKTKILNHMGLKWMEK